MTWRLAFVELIIEQSEDADSLAISIRNNDIHASVTQVPHHLKEQGAQERPEAEIEVYGT
jgi:hypothetical protein